MIDVANLTKRYGPTVAVQDLTFQVRPGRVTAFLGPNGSGKSTTMRLVLGLDVPTSGDARIGGRRYRDLPVPLREVGAMLDARALHPGRTARAHLWWLARTAGISRARVGEVLDTVGLTPAAGRRTGGFSLGMCQRLGIAAALLGDPPVVVLDEPVNGLDTDGIRWMRDLLRGLADEGRTVLISSHLLSEVERIADRVLVIGRGRLLADAAVPDLLRAGSSPVTVVASPAIEQLRHPLERAGAGMEPDPDGGWRIIGLPAAAVGELASHHGVPLHELRPLRSSLEDVYHRLVDASVDHRAHAEHTPEPTDQRQEVAP